MMDAIYHGPLWLLLHWWTQCIKSRNVAEAVFKEPGCGRRYGRQGSVWWRQCVRSQDVVGGRRDRRLYGGGNVSGAVMWL